VTSVAALVTAALLALSACGSDDETGASGSGSDASGPVELQLLIASSGDAETNAVKAAAKEWGTSTGNTVEVVPAKDINQQLTQALSGGSPPDLFYLDAGRFATLADGGSLADPGDRLEGADDFYPALVETFTYDDTFYCAPKDFSTLALQINTDMWAEAGLTDADVPTTWDELSAVAQKLSTPEHTGLVIGDTRDRIGAFMRQAGGWIVNDDATEMTADSPENLEALTYVQDLLTSGAAKYPKQLDAGWGGEAFGKGKAAMAMEGNWIQGAMKNDFPDVKYTVEELPAGPAGKGTLTFTQCWGVAEAGDHQDAAFEFVNFLTSKEQQLKFADAFGVMPSRESAKADFAAKYPEAKPFIEGGEYAQGPVSVPGFDAVLSEFDSGLFGLADGSSDPKKLLDDLQANGSDVIGG